MEKVNITVLRLFSTVSAYGRIRVMDIGRGYLFIFGLHSSSHRGRLWSLRWMVCVMWRCCVVVEKKKVSSQQTLLKLLSGIAKSPDHSPSFTTQAFR